MPSPICEVRQGAGAYGSTTYGVDVSAGASITIKLADQTGVNSWSIQCVTTDDTNVAATVTAGLTIDTATKTATLTAPATLGSTLRFRSVVNNGLDVNGVVDDELAATFCIYVLTIGGHRVLAMDETVEGHPDFGWIKPVNVHIRTGGGGGSTPGGSDTQVQFNDGGSALGGSSKFVFNKTTGAITATPASGTPSYAFGGATTVGLNSGAFAAGYSNAALNSWCVAIGSYNVVNSAGGVGIGETCVVNPGADNAFLGGFANTANGTFSGGIGCYLQLDGDYSFASGVSAATRQAGERVHGSSLTGVIVEKVWGATGTGTGAAVNLVDSVGNEFAAAFTTCHEMDIVISGVEAGAGSYGRAVFRVTVIESGGLTVANVTPVEKTGPFNTAAWTVTISGVGGSTVRINCNPGAATVKFTARATWIEQSIPGGSFNPASLAWDGWWRADTTSLEYNGLPWVPTASAGGSGSNGNLIAFDADPTVGTAQNGYSPAHTNGTTQDAQTVGSATTYVGYGAGTISLLVKTPASAGAYSTPPYNMPMFLGTQGSAVGMAWSTSGVTFFFYDGTAYAEITIACSPSNWHLLQMKWDGTNFWARVDSGAWSAPVATPGPGAGYLAVPFYVAKNSYASYFLSADYLEIAMATTAISDASLNNYKTSINSRYALSL